MGPGLSCLTSYRLSLTRWRRSKNVDFERTTIVTSFAVFPQLPFYYSTFDFLHSYRLFRFSLLLTRRLISFIAFVISHTFDKYRNLRIQFLEKPFRAAINLGVEWIVVCGDSESR